MNEIPNILEPKEKVIWDGKPRYAPYLIRIIFWGIIIGLFAGLVGGKYFGLITGIILFIVAFAIELVIGNISYSKIHYAITSRRAVFQSGIFGRNFKSINYDDIKNASVSVGLFNWLFSTGTINVFTGEMESTGGKYQQIRPKYDSFLYISDANDVLKELQEHLTEMEENLYGGKNVIQKVEIVK